MTYDDELGATRSALRIAGAEVADGTPSLDALYSLSAVLTEPELWTELLELVRSSWTARGVWGAWRDELRRLPSNPLLWFSRSDRNATMERALAEAEQRWRRASPERFFEARRPRAFIDGVAALHLALLAEVDPVGVVEYIAMLPSEQFIYPAVDWLQQTGRAPGLEDVVSTARTSDAVLLALSNALETAREEAHIRFAEARQGGEAAVAALEHAWTSEHESGFARLARLVLQRADAMRVIEGWLTHLVRASDRKPFSENDFRPELARIAVAEVVRHASEIGFAFAGPEVLDAGSIVMRMLLDTAGASADALWMEWHASLVACDRSLQRCGEIAWRTAGDTLARTRAPLDTWLATVTALEAVFRRRARRSDHETDHLPMNLVLPALHGAVRLGRDGQPLWLAAYEVARRSFLVDRPPHNEPGYQLPAMMFAGFERVFGASAALCEAYLEQLPTAQHVSWARELLERNAASGVSCGSTPPST
ncbi:MAG TPA: hypothetical protein VN253_07040 [Kofleriaceae bacterium]|nr:hypothetical protein [Kofleriaceae bacterium]